MEFKPDLGKWTGNEHELKVFDFAVNTPPRPALISHMSTVKGVQVVGGMVFDPIAMKWLDMASNEDESPFDPFEGLDDLDDVADAVMDIGPMPKGLSVSNSSLFPQSKLADPIDNTSDFERSDSWRANLQASEKKWRDQIRGLRKARPNEPLARQERSREISSILKTLRR